MQNDAISRTAAMRQFTDEPQETYTLAQIVAALDALPAVDAVEIDTLGNALRKAITAKRDGRTKEQAYGWEWEYNGFNFAIQAVTTTCIELKRQMIGKPREDGDGDGD